MWNMSFLVLKKGDSREREKDFFCNYRAETLSEKRHRPLIISLFLSFFAVIFCLSDSNQTSWTYFFYCIVFNKIKSVSQKTGLNNSGCMPCWKRDHRWDKFVNVCKIKPEYWSYWIGKGQLHNIWCQTYCVLAVGNKVCV